MTWLVFSLGFCGFRRSDETSSVDEVLCTVAVEDEVSGVDVFVDGNER